MNMVRNVTILVANTASCVAVLSGGMTWLVTLVLCLTSVWSSACRLSVCRLVWTWCICIVPMFVVVLAFVLVVVVRGGALIVLVVGTLLWSKVWFLCPVVGCL